MSAGCKLGPIVCQWAVDPRSASTELVGAYLLSGYKSETTGQQAINRQAVGRRAVGWQAMDRWQQAEELWGWQSHATLL